ncbi:hypothetical protein EDD22DRAFT_235253 [Suillus occidentalis]|nr:hypothetical protein EDD22DRAFT_235253 [Suillus occidentalis]
MASHARSVKYMTSETVSQLNDAVQRFQSGLDQCPIDHPCHAAALTNLTFPRLAGYIHIQDIDITISLFLEALASMKSCMSARRILTGPLIGIANAFGQFNLSSVLCFRFTQNWRMKMSRRPLISGKKRWGICLHYTQIAICDCRRPICRVTRFYTTLLDCRLL